MSTSIGYRGSVEITIKNKTYRRFNHGCPELFKTLAMCLCRQESARYHVPVYVSLYSETPEDVAEATNDIMLTESCFLFIPASVHPCVDLIEGSYTAVFTALILPDNVKYVDREYDSVTAALLSIDRTILAVTTIDGSVLKALNEGYSAQVKWQMHLTNVEV